MRAVPAALQSKLDSGVTTLCRCWIVTRRDGVVQGFTDHDEDVVGVLPVLVRVVNVDAGHRGEALHAGDVEESPVHVPLEIEVVRLDLHEEIVAEYP